MGKARETMPYRGDEKFILAWYLGWDTGPNGHFIHIRS